MVVRNEVNHGMGHLAPLKQSTVPIIDWRTHMRPAAAAGGSRAAALPPPPAQAPPTSAVPNGAWYSGEISGLVMPGGGGGQGDVPWRC